MVRSRESKFVERWSRNWASSLSRRSFPGRYTLYSASPTPSPYLFSILSSYPREIPSEIEEFAAVSIARIGRADRGSRVAVCRPRPTRRFPATVRRRVPAGTRRHV
jgi:hypothetical protein